MTWKEKPPLFREYLRRAEGEIDSSSLMSSAESAREKAGKHKNALKDVLATLFSFIRLLLAWQRGEYREISLKNAVIIAAAVLYFFAPVDAVPDFLPWLGFADDIAFILYVVGKLRDEMERFAAWEKSGGKSPDPGEKENFEKT